MKSPQIRILCVLCTLITLLIMMPWSLAEAAQNKSEIAFYTAEKWIANSKNSLLLNKNGTGKFTTNGKTFSGTWKLNGKDVVFTYQQYGEQKVEFSMYTRDDDPCLYAYSLEYFQKSVRSRRIKEAKAAAQVAMKKAERNVHSLKWDEKIDLDFVTFSFSNAAIYRVTGEILEPKRKYPYDVEEGKENKQYIVLTGNIKNNKDSDAWIDNLYAEIKIGDKTYKAKSAAVLPDKDYFTSCLSKNTSAKWYIIAEVPASVADSFQSARFRISFTKDLTSTPETFADGSYFFQLTISETKSKGMHKIASTREKTYFNLENNKYLPRPTSYTDIIYSYDYYKYKYPTYIDLIGKCKKHVCEYRFYPRYSDGDIETLCKEYIDGLRKDGFKVSKAHSKYDLGIGTWSGYQCYSIFKGRKLLGAFLFNVKTNGIYVVVYP